MQKSKYSQRVHRLFLAPVSPERFIFQLLPARPRWPSLWFPARAYCRPATPPPSRNSPESQGLRSAEGKGSFYSQSDVSAPVQREVARWRGSDVITVQAWRRTSRHSVAPSPLGRITHELWVMRFPRGPLTVCILSSWQLLLLLILHFGSTRQTEGRLESSRSKKRLLVLKKKNIYCDFDFNKKTSYKIKQRELKSHIFIKW